MIFIVQTQVTAESSACTEVADDLSDCIQEAGEFTACTPVADNLVGEHTRS